MPISKEEFDKITNVEARPGFVSKVTTEDLLGWLADKAVTTKEASEFLQCRTVSALSRLRRLQEKGLVVSKFDGKKLLFTKA